MKWARMTHLAKRKVRSQIGNLTPDHEKSRIDPIPLCASGMQQNVGNLSKRATTLLQTSSQSEVYKRSYHLVKSQEFQPWRFWDSHLGVPGQKAIWMKAPQRGAEYTIWGKVVASPKFGPW
jgi:hypothetical protein